MTTFNLLNYNNALRRADDTGKIVSISEYSTDWVAENGVLSVTGSNFVVDTRYVIQISPSSEAPVTLTLPSFPLNVRDLNRVLSFNLKIRANSSFTVESSLFINDIDTGVEPNIQSFTSGQYNAAQTNRITVPEAAALEGSLVNTATIRLRIINHSAATIFVTLPHLIHDEEFNANRFISFMRNFFPDFYWEIDSSQSNPTYPFFRLLDVLSFTASLTREEHDALYGVENGQLLVAGEQTQHWAKSILVSPSAVKNEYAPWLSQFTGSKLYRNFQNEDGTLYLDNTGLLRDFIQWQLRTSAYGRNAGTRGSMIEAARRVLIKTKNGEQSSFSVALTPQFEGDPFAIKVQTLTNETSDAETGEESRIVSYSVNLAKPLGYKLIHTTVDEFLFTFSDPTLGRLDFFRYG